MISPSFLSQACLSLACTALSLQTIQAESSLSSKEWTIDAMMQLKAIEEVQVSPNSQQVLYTATSAIMDDHTSVYQKSLHVAPLQGESFALNCEKSCFQPQWSPDSSRIAFLMADDKNRQQIWIWDLKQQSFHQLTHQQVAVTSFKWSPSGQDIAFTATDAPTEAEEKAQREKDDAYVAGENLKSNRLWVISTESEQAQPRQLTNGPHSVTLFNPFMGGGGYDWSPDATQLVCSLAPTAKLNGWRTCYLARIDVQKGETQPLVQMGLGEFHPLYSPDGKWIAFIASQGQPKWPLDFRVYVVDAQGKNPRMLAETPDHWPVRLLGWSADGQHIYATESRRTYKAITAVPVNGQKTYDVTPPNTLFIDAHLNRTGTHFGLSLESLQSPVEAFISSTKSFTPIQITQVNQAFRDYAMPRNTVIQWQSSDGLDIEGILTYPVNYQAGQRVPLALIVHGGPLSASRQDYIGNANPHNGPIAFLAQEGYAILRCNFRGSTGYGKTFRHLNVNDWGGKDYQDIMAGVDHLVGVGIADPERLVAIGWSFGGHMMGWILGRTDRFQAVIAGAGVYNCLNQAATCDIPDFYRDYFEVTQFPAWNKYRRFSPLFYLEKVTTPTLIEHGEQDKRVPIDQSYELFEALKSLNCPVKMMVYPRTPHFPLEPKLMRRLLYQRMEFLKEYVKN